MRVRLGDRAVSGPARVAEAMRHLVAVVSGRLPLQVREVADGANVRQAIVVQEGDAGGVVAAVLEPLQSGEEERLTGPGADISDDPAHDFPPETAKLGWGCPSSGLSRALAGREPRC